MTRAEEIINEIDELEPVAGRICSYTTDNVIAINELEQQKNGENDEEIDAKIQHLVDENERVGHWMTVIMTHVVHIKCELAHIDRKIAREYIEPEIMDCDPGDIDEDDWKLIELARRNFPAAA